MFFLSIIVSCSQAPVDMTVSTESGTATIETAETAASSTVTNTTSTPQTTATDAVAIMTDCTPGGVVYGTEGEFLTITPSCLDKDIADSFTMTDVPDGAMWDDTSGVLLWLPGVDQAGHHQLPVMAYGPTGSQVGEIDVWIADGWANPDNVAVDSMTYTFENGLPVVHLERPSGANSSNYVSASFIYKGEEFLIDMKYRGASSLGYPKNSYTLKFSADHEFKDGDLDFHKRHKIVLTTTFDDNSYLRQRLCFDIWNLLDSGRHAVQTMHVVVYINGEYEGLYLLGDHIDGEYWEDQGFREHGNTYKAVNHDANYYNTRPQDGFEKKEGEPLSGFGSFEDLSSLIAFINDADDTEFASGLATWLAVDEFMDWWALVRYTESGDSAGKNAYLYNDPKDPLFHYAPWDFNHSLGQDWMTLRVSYNTGGEFTGSNQIFARLLSHPTLSVVFKDRWRTHLAGVLHADNITARIDTITAEIGPSAQRDWEKWEDDYRSYGGWSWYRNGDWTSYEEEVSLVRTWVSDRHQWLTTEYGF